MAEEPKIEWPNFTITPNRIFATLRFMKEAELKCTLMICRQTFGYQNQGKQKLTIEELQALTGLSRPTVVHGVADGMRRGTLCRERQGMGFAYGLNLSLDEEEAVKNFSSPAKAEQLKNFTDGNPEAVKKFNSTLLNKEKPKKKPTDAPPTPSPSGKKISRSRYGRELAAAAPQEREDAEFLVEEWKRIFGFNEELVTERRMLRAVYRLRDGKTRAQLEEALWGVYHSDFHMKRGRHVNRDGPQYNGFEWILDSVERVEDFIRREREWRSARNNLKEVAGGGGGAVTEAPGGGRTGRRQSKRAGDSSKWRGYGELEED